ncbi:ATP synthase F1 subunit gamma [Candidatus Zinderia endosymbiont of Aphrophora alni]|uniref:ATP synthase F1 subunit gamma n=1 Tax=Candidatus Zinderia endosymbiont of Aphrophora alni TaxID=3077951 RepID=UPI0030D0F7DF
MSIAKEISIKINSIKNTKKITKAMEMIAVSKMHKIQKKMFLIRNYYNKIKKIIFNLLFLNINYKHDFIFKKNNSKKVGFIIVSTDKGLCSGINSNLFKLFFLKIKKKKINKKNIKIVSIGSKSFNFFTHLNYKIISYVNNINEFSIFKKIIGPINSIINLYNKNKIKIIYLLYNKCINTFKQEPLIKQLLPIKKNYKNFNKKKKYNNNYLFEPNKKKVISKLLIRYLETIVLQAVIENITSEQSARMITMSNASNSADNIIDNLKLKFNKTRQYFITNELSEIISGSMNI